MCPKGTAPLGGGALTAGGFVKDIHLIASRPLFPGDPNTGDEDYAAAPIGWYGMAGRNTPDDKWMSISVWAICIPVQQ